jgi:hypothetical protein
MDVVEYISYLYDNYDFDSELDNATTALLYFFTESKVASTYDCYIYLNSVYKKENKSIAYKNVHTKVKRLRELKMIERKDNDGNNKKSIHNPIYYFVTELGILYLFKKRLTRGDKKIVTQFRENKFYEFFLYQYVALDTIDKINYNPIHVDIFEYISKCSLTVEKLLRQLRNTYEDGEPQLSIAPVNTIVDPQYDYEYHTGSREFINYLKDKFDIKWLDVDKTQIIEIEKNKLIEIVNDMQNSLLLEVFIGENKTVLSHKDGTTIFEFDLQKIGEESYLLCEKVSTDELIKKIFLGHYSWFNVEMRNSLFELINKILNYTVQASDEIHFKKNNEINLSIKVLARDRNFLSHIEMVKENFDYKYNSFLGIVQ